MSMKERCCRLTFFVNILLVNFLDTLDGDFLGIHVRSAAARLDLRRCYWGIVFFQQLGKPWCSYQKVRLCPWLWLSGKGNNGKPNEGENGFHVQIFCPRKKMRDLRTPIAVTCELECTHQPSEVLTLDTKSYFDSL